MFEHAHNECIEANLTRREFTVGSAAVGAVVAGTALIGTASADETTIPARTGGGVTQAQQIAQIDPDWFDPRSSDQVLLDVLNESEVEGDLTLPDGTVVPEIYVKLRNRINRIGRGVGSQPTAGSWSMIMHLWTEEDALHELEMPMLKTFTVYDYAAESGRPLNECAEILKDMSSRCLVYHMRRGGKDYYMLPPNIDGFWEFTELKVYYDALAQGSDGMSELVEWNANTGLFGASTADFDGTFPLFRSYPISPDVVEGGNLLPYNDWRQIILNNEMITVSPCQCRLVEDAIGMPYPEEQPMRTCLSLGEMAEYFIENGIGEQITQEEAIAIYEDAIAKGMVPESIACKDADIMCCCHADSCFAFMALKGVCQDGKPAWKNYNAYVLDYDEQACIGCGACVTRCPLHAIELGDDGKCTHDMSCVRCGHCAAVCPAHARKLVARDDWPELPEDYLDCHVYFAKERMARGFTFDFTETSL